MTSKNSAKPLLPASPPCDAKADAAAVTDALLDLYSPLEVAAGGVGTINDPSGADTRPPGTCDVDPSFYA